MRVEEAARLVGMSAKNIRFYEEEGLITVRRASGNRYRDLSMEDVEQLKRIKLMRKLNIPLAEIRRTLSGSQTLMDCIERHRVTLLREKKNIEQADALCADMLRDGCSLKEMDAEGCLARMEQMEREGTRFMDVQKGDKRRRVVAPILCALVMILLMAGYIALLAWAVTDGMPLIVLILIAVIPLCVIVGVSIALIQRIKEIYKGEDETDAVGKY